MVNRWITALAATGAAGIAHRGFTRPIPQRTPRRNSSSIAPPPAEQLAERLAELIRQPTETGNLEAFEQLHRCFEQFYPTLWRVLEREVVGDHGLLLRLPGSDVSWAKHPVVLMAHQDVVPVAGQAWSFDPYAGKISEGRVHGRGALDDKGALLVTLEALEALLNSGFTPMRDVYVALSDNEEVAGTTAATMVDLLDGRGIRPWLVLDEGGAVVEAGALPGLRRPAAMIGLSEKGMLDLQLTAAHDGGHASTPPRDGATAQLARAILALEANQFPAVMTPPVVSMLQAAATATPGPLGAVYAAADRLAGPLAWVLARLGDETSALVRTTMAVTQLTASPARNVLATSASASVNLRLAIGTTVESAVEHVRRAINDDRISIKVVEGHDPLPVSPPEGAQWDVLAAALASAYPEAVAVGYMQNGATDSRHFNRISEHVYRFAPLRMNAADRARIHAADESIEVATLPAGVEFIASVIQQAAGQSH